MSRRPLNAGRCAYSARGLNTWRVRAGAEQRRVRRMCGEGCTRTGHAHGARPRPESTHAIGARAKTDTGEKRGSEFARVGAGRGERGARARAAAHLLERAVERQRAQPVPGRAARLGRRVVAVAVARERREHERPAGGRGAQASAPAGAPAGAIRVRWILQACGLPLSSSLLELSGHQHNSGPPAEHDRNGCSRVKLCQLRLQRRDVDLGGRGRVWV